METKTTLLKKSLIVCATFALSTIIAYSALSSPTGTLKSQIYTSIEPGWIVDIFESSEKDIIALAWWTNQFKTILDWIISSKQNQAEQQVGPMAAPEFLGSYLSKVLNIDNAFSTDPDYNDIYKPILQYIYPRILELKNTYILSGSQKKVVDDLINNSYQNYKLSFVWGTSDKKDSYYSSLSALSENWTKWSYCWYFWFRSSVNSCEAVRYYNSERDKLVETLRTIINSLPDPIKSITAVSNATYSNGNDYKIVVINEWITNVLVVVNSYIEQINLPLSKTNYYFTKSNSILSIIPAQGWNPVVKISFYSYNSINVKFSDTTQIAEYSADTKIVKLNWEIIKPENQNVKANTNQYINESFTNVSGSDGAEMISFPDSSIIWTIVESSIDQVNLPLTMNNYTFKSSWNTLEVYNSTWEILVLKYNTTISTVWAKMTFGNQSKIILVINNGPNEISIWGTFVSFIKPTSIQTQEDKAKALLDQLK